MNVRFLLNHSLCDIELHPGEVVLDVVRRILGLKGTKEGCREGDCGACSVLLGQLEYSKPLPQLEPGLEPGIELPERELRYGVMASCLLPAAELASSHLVTIEGLNGEGLSPIQQAFVEEGASQCGFCTPGFIVALTGFLLSAPAITMEEACAAIEGQICRCTGYAAIRRAMERIVEQFRDTPLNREERIPYLVAMGILPQHFLNARALLDSMPVVPVSHEGVPVAGGTDLFVQKATQLKYEEIQLLMHRPELKGIRREETSLVLGAAVTAEELLRSDLIRDAWPELETQLRLVSSQLIRRRATIGGNLVNASPIGDLSIMLLALGGRLQLQTAEKQRELPLEDFFLAYKKLDLKPGELIRSVSVELPGANTFFHFDKVSQRRHLDIAAVNSALCLDLTDGVIQQARLAAGGVAPIPLLLRETSAMLAGKALNAELASLAAKSASEEVKPIDDVRGSADYKRSLLGSQVRGHFEALFAQLGEQA